jgi:hypothetical protein
MLTIREVWALSAPCPYFYTEIYVLWWWSHNDPDDGAPRHRPRTGPDTSKQLVGLQHLVDVSSQQGLEAAALVRYAHDTGPFVGPDTSTQLVGLKHLEEIAGGQGAPGHQSLGSYVRPLARPGDPGPATSILNRLASPVRSRWARVPLLHRVPLPLAVVLVIQLALSLRLVWSNTAFADEALYLWAGHLEWAHWLDGTSLGSAGLPSYFSGAPVIYPPLGALADSVGGLAGARLLSLAFMLGATCLLYATTLRLFDRRSGLFAVGLFVGVGSTQFLSAFATYDAMALFLLTLATWLGVRSASAGRWQAAGLLAAAGAAMALADAAKYAATLFDTVVVGVVLLAMWRLAGGRRAVWGTCVLLGVAAALIAGALVAGGHAYWAGISLTTTARASGTTPMPGVLFVSGKWAGAVAFLAVCGALAIGWSGSLRERLLGCVLAIAVFLAPIEQARIHTMVSLYKHVGYGAWFGCVAAGFALASLGKVVPRVKVQMAIRTGVAAVVLASISGFWYSEQHFEVWPDSTRYVAALKPWLDSSRGHVLIDTAPVPEYYLRTTHFELIADTSYFAYTDPYTLQRLTNPIAAYADAIKHGYFALISLTNGNAPTVYDPHIIADIKEYGGYRLVSDIPYKTPSDQGEFLTWVRTGPSH